AAFARSTAVGPRLAAGTSASRSRCSTGTGKRRSAGIPLADLAAVARGRRRPYLSAVEPPGFLPPLARMPEEWADVLKSCGGRPFHARQLFRWMHARGVVDAASMTDLPARLRE